MIEKRRAAPAPIAMPFAPRPLLSPGVLTRPPPCVSSGCRGRAREGLPSWINATVLRLRHGQGGSQAAKKRGHMKQILAIMATVAGVVAVTLSAQAPTPQPPGPRPPATPTADPYASNPEAGKTQFPLAAPAGKDSGAKQTAPAGAANQGAFDPATWKYGTSFNAPAGSKSGIHESEK